MATVAALVLLLAAASPSRLLAEQLVTARPEEIRSCQLESKTKSGHYAATSFLDENGKEVRRLIEWQGVAAPAEAAHKTSDIEVHWLGTVDGSEPMKLADGWVSMRIQPNIVLTNPTILAFSRGDYVNLDLALSKIFMPHYQNPDGTLDAQETFDRLAAFDEGEPHIRWFLKEANDPSSALADGSLQTAFIDEVKESFANVTERLSAMQRDFGTACKPL